MIVGARLADNLAFAWAGVLAHRLRSLMTALGVVIGIASVIAMATIVTALSTSVSASTGGLGANSLSIRAYTPFAEQLRGVTNHLSLADYYQVRAAVGPRAETTAVLSPYGAFGTTIRSGRVATPTKVNAVFLNYQETNSTFVAQGRFLNPADLTFHKHVCVMGYDVARDLGLGDHPIGQFVRMGALWVRIVGIMQEKGEIFGISQDDYVVIPFTLGVEIGRSSSKQDISITLNVLDPSNMEIVSSKALAALRKLHRTSSTGDTFKIQSSKQLQEALDSITSSISMALIGIVAISLLVGGIGIMNIMLVSVTERTREIGIAKALGARKGDIAVQFLAEAVIISLVGGMIGLILGIFVAFMVSLVVPYVSITAIPLWSIVAAIIVSIGTGIIPAMKAAAMRPIDALRHE